MVGRTLEGVGKAPIFIFFEAIRSTKKNIIDDRNFNVSIGAN
jgi:hypothetical protein